MTTFENLVVFKTLLLTVASLVSLAYGFKKRLFKDFILISAGLLGFASSCLALLWYRENPTVFPFITSTLGTVLIALGVKRIATGSLSKLERVAFYDPLTGAYNRNFVEEFLKEELKRGTRLDVEFSILLIDLNDFKLVNDNYGHDAGDHVLKQVVSELRKKLREYDMIARWGGDEFLVVLPNICGPEVLEVVSRLSEGFMLPYRDIIITLSVGYACYPQDGRDLERLLQVADERMYRAKQIHKEAKRHALGDKSKKKI